MLKLIIEDDEGRRTVVPFVREEITIGRQEGNTIRLTERNVSRRHARLLRQDAAVLVEDLGSYNGIRVNGEKVVGRASIDDGDLVQIGDYDLAIQREAGDPRPATPPPLVPMAEAEPDPQDEPETEASSPAYLSEQVEDTAPSSSLLADTLRRQALSRPEAVSPVLPELLDLDPEEAPRLVVVNTELAGREYACIRSELSIGRVGENDISLDHRSLSRTHARLTRGQGGAWKVVDLQSANGLLVNGEPCTEATLRHLDTLELGQVKVRFVGAGQSYTWSAAEEQKAAAKQRRPSRGPLWALAGLLGAAALGGAGYFAHLQGFLPLPLVPFAGEPGQPAHPIVPPIPEQVAEPAEVAEPGEAAVTEAVEKEEELQEPAVAVATPQPERATVAKRLLGSFPAVLSTGNLIRARKILDDVGALEGLPAELVEQAEDFQDQLVSEQQVYRRLEAAQRALVGGKLEQAQQLLEETRSTAAFGRRHRTLSSLLEQKLEVVRAGGRDPARPRPSAEAKKLFDEGLALFNKRQYKEARAAFDRCVETDARFARCHLMLGSTHARLGDGATGAKHYEQFLQLSPDATEAPKVRELLDDYKQSQKVPN